MKKLCCLTAMLLVMLPLFALAQGAGKSEKAPAPGDAMDKLFEFWNRLDQPGFAVVVVKDGTVVYQKVFGLACQEHAVAITPKSVFNTATLAQPFVGMALAMLEKQGKLSLENDVRKYIPELPEYTAPIKLRHLLFHSSGLRDWLAVNQLAGRTWNEVTIDQVIKMVKGQKRTVFAPGLVPQYSNTNYDLLAEVVKRATGVAFSEWAWQNIFKPLKMTRTAFRDNCRSIFDDQAFSYNYTRSEYLRGIDNLSVVGSHSLFSSIDDLAKWLLNHESGQVGGKEIFAKMFSAGLLDNGQSSGFGYGLSIAARPGRPMVTQTGTWAGSEAAMAYYPEQRFGAIVLANWDYTPVDGFLEGIAEIWLPAAPAMPSKPAPQAGAKKAVKVSPEKLESYTGTFRLAPTVVLAITRSKDQLVLGVQGMTLPLTAISDTEFELAVASARILFKKGKDGKVHEMVWKQGGSDVIAPKIVLVKPTIEKLKEYAGSYANEEVNLGFAIELRGDRLVMTAPNQSEYNLAPEESDSFTTGWRMFPKVFFQRDAQKKLSGIRFDNGSVRDLLFKKN